MLFLCDTGDVADLDVNWPKDKPCIDFNISELRTGTTYLHFWNNYAVTTDGGRHWSTTDFSRLFDKDSVARVMRVTVNSDGSGLAEALQFTASNPFEPDANNVFQHKLRTSDFGRSWRLADGA